MKNMTLWAVLPAYDKDNTLYYQVLPYNVKGTILCHFKYQKGLFSLIPFLCKCRLTEKEGKKLACKRMIKNKV